MKPNGHAKIVRLCKLLSDEARVQIIELLKSGESCVLQIMSHLKMSQPATSHHVALLRNAGLIRLRRDGKHNFYSLASDKLSTVLTALGQAA
jgi:ArsR family transcriptional regulator